MKRVQFKFAAIAAMAVAASALAGPMPAHAKNNTAAIVGGIIAGAAVGAAISSSIDHPKKVYVPGPPPPRPAWDKVYQPNNNIWCYPAQRACYNRNGVYDAKWTYKVYAR
jgi:hypothetical protein